MTQMDILKQQHEILARQQQAQINQINGMAEAKALYEEILNFHNQIQAHMKEGNIVNDEVDGVLHTEPANLSLRPDQDPLVLLGEIRRDMVDWATWFKKMVKTYPYDGRGRFGIESLSLYNGHLLIKDGSRFSYSVGANYFAEKIRFDKIELEKVVCGALIPAKYHKEISDNFAIALGDTHSYDAYSIKIMDNTPTNLKCTLRGHSKPVKGMLSPDGEVLFSYSSDLTIRVWDITRERCIAVLKGHKAPICAMAFSPN